MNLGRAALAAVVKSGVSQGEIARTTGVTKQMVSLWLRDRRPGYEALCVLEQEYGIAMNSWSDAVPDPSDSDAGSEAQQ
jgi:transcriptional regulator with XRE-family HTH domain